MERSIKDYFINLIENDLPIPEDMKEHIFPNLKEEYELVYGGKMRKEDVLSNEDGTFPLPLQVDSVFAGDKYKPFEDDWKNLIVFGDNLQFLKTVYEDKDSVIRSKVKGKVKLIYIDPPFATLDEFQNQDGAKAYNDKKQGAEFLEFLRRRLILAKEILADDGSIFVHVDPKMGHYVKIVMDEVFGKNNFINEIIWHFKTYQGNAKNYYPRKHNNIFWYSKNTNPDFELQYDDSFEDTVDAERWRKYVVEGNKIKGGHYPKSDSRFKGYYDRFVNENGRKPKAEDVIMTIKGYVVDDVWVDIRAIDPKNKSERVGYPTQKPEALLERIIESATKPGDIVLDFFGGSGTTMAVAEKLERKWIVCDLGKLSYFTMQKRLLTISNSKALNSNEKYNIEPRSFITCKLGMYDLKETLSLEWEKYKNFVAQLFEFDLEVNSINGVNFEGVKRSFPVKIFNYDKYTDTKIDEQYLQNLYDSLGSSAPSRIYIISPATRVLFLADYEQIGDTKFYFLNVPYEMIRELHKTPFLKFRQPKSKTKINEVDEMKGFQFVDKPEVSCHLEEEDNTIKFVVDKFETYSIKHGKIDDFSTLSSIYVDYDNNMEYFLLDEVRFWDEIESTSKNHNDTEIVKDSEGIITKIVWTFNKEVLGANSMFIISDIYGNDFKVNPGLEEK